MTRVADGGGRKPRGLTGGGGDHGGIGQPARAAAGPAGAQIAGAVEQQRLSAAATSAETPTSGAGCSASSAALAKVVGAEATGAA